MDLNITPGRSLNLLYIILDSIFVIFYVCFLFYKKRKDAAIMYCTPLTGPRSNSNDGWIPWNPSIGAAPKP